MGLVRNSHFDKISGKVGSVVFANTRNGNIIRAFPKINRKYTPARGNIRKMMVSVARSHRKLNFKQYEAWAKFTKSEKHKNRVHEIVHYNWRDVFQKLNMNRLLIKEPLFLDPPVNKNIPETFNSIRVQTYASKQLDDIRIFFSPKINKDTKYILYATFILNKGIFNPKDSAYKYFAVIDHTFLSGSSIYNEYMDYFKSNQNPGSPTIQLDSISALFLFLPAALPILLKLWLTLTNAAGQ